MTTMVVKSSKGIKEVGKFSILKNPTKPSILKLIIMVISLLNNIHMLVNCGAILSPVDSNFGLCW